MVVRFSAHAQDKLSVRKVTEQDVIGVIENPSEQLEDIEHSLKVAIGPLNARSLVVIYRTIGNDVKVITVYHTRKLEKLIRAKINRGAWRRVE